MISAPIPAVTVTPGDSVVIDLTQGAKDANGDPITIENARVAAPSHGDLVIGKGPSAPAGGAGRVSAGSAFFFRPVEGATTVTYTPDEGWRGTDTIAYTLTDGDGGTVDGTVQVTTPNAVPRAVNDRATAERRLGDGAIGPKAVIAVLDNDTDENDDPVALHSVAQPSNGHVRANPDGTVTYFGETSKGPYTDRFSYTVADGHGGVDTATVAVSVEGLGEEAGAELSLSEKHGPHDESYTGVLLEAHGLPVGASGTVEVTLHGWASWAGVTPTGPRPDCELAPAQPAPGDTVTVRCSVSEMGDLHLDFVADRWSAVLTHDGRTSEPVSGS